MDINSFISWVENLDPTLEVTSILNDGPIKSVFKAIVANARKTGQDVVVSLMAAASLIEKMSGLKLGFEVKQLDPRAGRAGLEYYEKDGWTHYGYGVLVKATDYSSNGDTDFVYMNDALAFVID